MRGIESYDLPVTIPIPEAPPLDIGAFQESDVISSENIEADLGVQGIPKIPIPLKNRLFDDPGMYKAEIIYNPDNKRAVQGYVHVPVIKVEDFKPPEKMRLAISGLADAVNSMTNITAVIDNPLPSLHIVKLIPLKENSFSVLTVH